MAEFGYSEEEEAVIFSLFDIVDGILTFGFLSSYNVSNRIIVKHVKQVFTIDFYNFELR